MSNTTSLRNRIDHKVSDGVIEQIDFECYGILRVTGWSARAPQTFITAVGSHGALPLLNHFLLARPDLVKSGHASAFQLEFKVSIDALPIELRADGTVLDQFTLEKVSAVGMRAPEYAILLDTDHVPARENIYSVGMPSDSLSPEVLMLAETLEPPILDFGCGSGVLVRALRGEGREVRGLEVDRPEIRETLSKKDAAGITLYRGTLPLPYDNNEFKSVIASEVLEHIVDYQPVIRELARITSQNLLVTVPDMACIPMTSVHHVVPIHLLEASHVNFFTAKSMTAALAPYFSSFKIYRVGNFEVNSCFVPGSLALLCSGKKPFLR
ncbi:MAG: class I SAM-dependent methyltransferase [Bdellovibrionota bacterium]